jgi:hypothetical protein
MRLKKPYVPSRYSKNTIVKLIYIYIYDVAETPRCSRRARRWWRRRTGRRRESRRRARLGGRLALVPDDGGDASYRKMRVAVNSAMSARWTTWSARSCPTAGPAADPSTAPSLVPRPSQRHRPPWTWSLGSSPPSQLA